VKHFVQKLPKQLFDGFKIILKMSENTIRFKLENFFQTISVSVYSYNP